MHYPTDNGDQDNHLGIDPAPRFLQIAELSRHGVVIIDRPHEMRDRRRVPMYDLANVSLVIAPYPQELLEYRDYGKQALLVHQPHPVEPRLFEHDVEQPRSIDVMLAGSLEGPMYPLRHRLGNLIKEGTLPGKHKKCYSNACFLIAFGAIRVYTTTSRISRHSHGGGA